jgi:hypothetical protein
MGVPRCHLKTIVKGAGDYHEKRWNVWFLIRETHRGQQVTPALTLPQVRYGLSVLLLEVFCTPGLDYICRQVSRRLMRNELARFYHHRTRKCLPQRKLRRIIQ